MPIEIRRFGVGHRRREGPPGTTGLEGQPIFWDARGGFAELVFKKGGRITPHDNPNTAWFVVIEGGGWVLVGEEERRVAAGEAVLWPANVIHSAWTDHTEMRAIVIEFAGADDAAALLEGTARRLAAGETGGAARGEGHLAERPPDPAKHDRSEGEPL